MSMKITWFFNDYFIYFCRASGDGFEDCCENSRWHFENSCLGHNNPSKCPPP